MRIDDLHAPQRIDLVPLLQVKSNPCSREETVKLIRGPQGVSADIDTQRAILDLIAQDVLQGARCDVGRSGLDLWSISVLLSCREALRLDYDRLAVLAGNHTLIRAVMGLVDGRKECHFDGIRIGRNVRKGRAQTVTAINRRVVRLGHQSGPAAAESARVDSFVTQTNFHPPSEIRQVADGLRLVLRQGFRLVQAMGSTLLRQHAHLENRVRQLVLTVSLSAVSKHRIRGGRPCWSRWPLGTVVALAAVLGCRADAVDHDLERAHHGDLEFDVGLLKRGPVTTEVEAFFRIARTAFQTHPMAAFSDLEELPAAAERRGLTHLGGPLLGCLAPDGIRVWVRTLRPAQVEVAVDLPGGQERRFPPVASTIATDLTAVVPVTGLEPETRYPYRVLIDGHPIVLPPESVFTTAPRPGAATRQRIAFGADCHKFGIWDRGLLGRMRARGAGALLLLGDLASDDRQQRVGLLRSDYLLRDLSPAWQAVAAGMPVYATWDDHDYWSNDQFGIPHGATAADRTAVRTVWQQNWNNPGAGIPGRDEGIFFQARVGLCDLIMLDTRYFRTRPGEPDAFLGQDQMRWLEERLAACTGPFIILTSGTMWTDEVSQGKDSWGAWDPSARERILSLIEAKRIPGVLLLSGDRHGARVMRLPRPSGYTFYEFELGSLGGRGGPPARGAHPALQPFGLVNTAAFGEFTVDTSGQEPTVTMRVIDADGKERFQLALTRQQLTPGKP